MAKAVKTKSGRWHIQIEIGGVRDSGTFATKREADAWAQARATELRAFKRGEAGTVKTLLDAISEYEEKVAPTKRGERWELLRLRAFRESEDHAALPLRRKLADIDRDVIEAWRDARLAKVSTGTVLRELGLLSSVFQAAVDWRWIGANPVRAAKKPPAPRSRSRLIADAEIAAMLLALGHTDGKPRSVNQAVARCFLLALATGMRAGELCALTWSNVYADHVHLPMTKNGNARDVPLSRDARKQIEAMRGWDDTLVFGLRSQTLDALFRKARQRAGLDGFTFHDARHVAATRIAMSGKIGVMELCAMFGWSDPRMAAVYFNPTASDIAAKLG